jgi:predicted nucleic acid-binding protein
MSAPDFVDTNVLIYAYDSTDQRKGRIARGLLLQALSGKIVTSTQVLAEFAATLLHKMSPPARPEDVASLLDALGPIPVILPDADIVRRAVEARMKYGVHFYDGMILAAAERADCGRIWSEDFNAGQRYFGIVVENPFAGPPARKTRA